MKLHFHTSPFQHLWMVGLSVPSPYLIKRRAEQSALVEIANLAQQPKVPKKPLQLPSRYPQGSDDLCVEGHFGTTQRQLTTQVQQTNDLGSYMWCPWTQTVCILKEIGCIYCTVYREERREDRVNSGEKMMYTYTNSGQSSSGLIVIPISDGRISLWTIDFHIFSRDQVGQGWFVKVLRSTTTTPLRHQHGPLETWSNWCLCFDCFEASPYLFSTVFTSRNNVRKNIMYTSFPFNSKAKRNYTHFRHKRQDADITVAGGTVVAWNGWRLMSCLCF